MSPNLTIFCSSFLLKLHLALAGLSCSQNPGAVLGSKPHINPDVLAEAFQLDKNVVIFGHGSGEITIGTLFLTDLQSSLRIDSIHDSKISHIKHVRSSIPFSAFWLRSSVVYVLISLISDMCAKLESMSPPPTLQRLRLEGRLTRLPGWISELENLVKVSLHWSGISDGSIKILGDLPKLLEVWVHEGYDGVELHFEQGKFQKLKYLALRCLYKLEKVVIARGSLACLETLGIGPSPLLQEVPINIGNLECLKNLEFHNMPKEFAQKILPSEGQDYWKVKGIPNVCLQYTGRGLYGETYKLGDFRLRQYLYQT